LLLVFSPDLEGTLMTAWYSTILSFLTTTFSLDTSAVRISLTVRAVSVIAFCTASSKLLVDSPRMSMYLKTIGLGCTLSF
jgi:hypothetical protein